MKENTEKIAEYIFVKPKLKKADLIFVFGGLHVEAAVKACKLYKRFAPKILISGGENRTTGKNEAKELSRKLIELGVKGEDIILEDKSNNTFENVLFSKKVIEDKIGFDNIKKISIVTKNYHMRRAIMTLKKYFPKSIKFLPNPYKIKNWDKNNWYKNEDSNKKVISEFEKIQKYLKKGDIEEL